MQRWRLRSKLHRPRVTGTDKGYEGSIAVDVDLLEAADIAFGERVQVVNVTNGERFHTYTIEGEAGQVAVNGAAARLAETGDVLILIAYGLYDGSAEANPTVVVLDEDDEIADRK